MRTSNSLRGTSKLLKEDIVVQNPPNDKLWIKGTRKPSHLTMNWLEYHNCVVIVAWPMTVYREGLLFEHCVNTWSREPCEFLHMRHCPPPPLCQYYSVCVGWESVKCPHLALAEPLSLLSRGRTGGGATLLQWAVEELRVVCYVGDSQCICL